MLNRRMYSGVWCEGSAPSLRTLAKNHLSVDAVLDLTTSPYSLSESLSMLEQGEGTFSFIATPLCDCPTIITNSLVFAALSTREEPATFIFTKQHQLDFSQDLFLAPGSRTLYTNQRIAEQLKQVRNDLIWTKYDGNTELLRDHDALITLQSDPIGETVCWDKRDISPWECIPSPGAGVVAYICRKEDIELRSHLRKIHAETSSRCTNVERKLSKNMPDQVKDFFSAYMFQDKNGYFHIAVHIGHPSFPPVLWRQSNSSSTQLEANMLENCNTWLANSGLLVS